MIQPIRRIFFIILLVFFIIFAVSGVYSTQSLDNLAYVTALGLDVGETDDLKITIQLTKPTNSSSSESSENTNIVNSVECSSIETGLNLFNSYISKRIDLSHCKVLVISEELASKGISDYMYTLLSSVDMSPHANVIVSKSSSEEFIKSSKPVLESLASNYYETVFSASEYTGYTQDVTLIKFFDSYVDTCQDPVAVLGNINSEENIENMGLAVFNDAQFVGELDGFESIMHLLVSNKLKSCNILIPNPLGDTENIDVYLTMDKKTKNSVDFVNGSPYATSKIYVNIQIDSSSKASTTEAGNYYSEENSKLIEASCNKYLEQLVTEYLYKTAKQFNSDIDGFGKYAVKNFSTIQEWENYNWLENYKNTIFNVQVESKLKSGNTFL